MATINIIPNGQYKTKNESYTTWGSWPSSWTDQSVNDGDNNSYYLGRFSYSSYDTETFYHWIPRLKITIPTSISISNTNKLTVAMKTPGAAYITSIKAILSARDCGPDPATINNDTASQISVSAFYTDASKSDTYYHETISSGTVAYLVFDSFTTQLVPGSTYYIYFIPFYYSSWTTINFNSMGFHMRNMSGYTTVTLDYEAGAAKIWNGSAWVNATHYVWNGSTWKRATPYVWDGSAWKQPK
jgi:hypothetical protein